MKTCSKCEASLPLSEFRYSKSKNRHEAYCKKCTTIYIREHRQKIKEGYTFKSKYDNISRKDPLYQKNWLLVKKYGISLKDKARMNKNQNSCCAICNRKESSKLKLVVDHNHNNLDVRGLLCNACNSLLGMYQEDPILIKKVLRNFTEYLKKEPFERLSL